MLDITKIVKTYSGKRGCMCGCLGKYSYTQDGAKNFDMMIRSEFQDQALAKVEREARRAKMAKAVANDIFGV